MKIICFQKFYFTRILEGKEIRNNGFEVIHLREKLDQASYFTVIYILCNTITFNGTTEGLCQHGM